MCVSVDSQFVRGVNQQLVSFLQGFMLLYKKLRPTPVTRGGIKQWFVS